MSSLRANILVQPQEIFTSSSTQGTDLGALATTGDGRYFRYCKAGAANLVPGQVYQGPASDATNLNPAGGLSIGQSNATGSFGPFTISNSLTVTANQLAGGFMSVAVTPGQGYNYKVKSNSAVSGVTGLSIVLEDPLQTNLSTASRVVFALNQYNGVVVVGQQPTAAVVGVAVYPVVATQFGWLQTRGEASVLVAGTLSAGVEIGVGALNITGAASPATGFNWVGIGEMSGTGTSGEYDNAFLNLD